MCDKYFGEKKVNWYDSSAAGTLTINDGDYNPEINYVIKGGYGFKAMGTLSTYCSPLEWGETDKKCFAKPIQCKECLKKFTVKASWEFLFVIAHHLQFEHPEIFFEAMIQDELELR